MYWSFLFYFILFFLFLITVPLSKFDARYDRKFVSGAFFWHEVEEEFRTRNIDWCFKGNEGENLEEALNAINDLRKGELYQHEQANCSTLCKEKGEFSFVYGLLVVGSPRCFSIFVFSIPLTGKIDQFIYTGTLVLLTRVVLA